LFSDLLYQMKIGQDMKKRIGEYLLLK